MSGFGYGGGEPRWVPDNESEFCANCNDQFSFLNRKHHCRACGKLLCVQCCGHWLLIPKDHLLSSPTTVEDPAIPQRCCSGCSRVLQGQQTELRMALSKANAPLRFDKDSAERNYNVPISRKMETDLRKATYTLYNFQFDDPIQGKDGIPKELIKRAKGIVFITILKAGFVFTGRVGTGLVIARLDDGSWSAPSSVGMSGMGWGFQVGGELTDVILILTNKAAVDAFTSKTQVSLGTELAISVGPVGRSAGTDVHGGSKGASAAYSYAHSKGLFFGISLEASVIACRPDINRQFYGMEVTPAMLLNGVHPRPKAADPLYLALDELMSTALAGDNESGRHIRTSPNYPPRWGDEDEEISQPNPMMNVPTGPSERYETTDVVQPEDAWTRERTQRLKESVQKENEEILRMRMQHKQIEEHELESKNVTKYTAFNDNLGLGDDEDDYDEDVDLSNPHNNMSHHYEVDFNKGNGSARNVSGSSNGSGKKNNSNYDDVNF